VNPHSEDHIHRTIESVARASYGRLIAFLCARTRDVAGAEDAMGEALIAALTTWPRDGVPRNPEGWLLTAARNRLIDRARHERMRLQSAPTLELIAGDSADVTASNPIPDERLKLLFVCTHPAIDPDMHTPLMLQTVLGLDAAEIARAFLVSPTTMGQRLVRSKTKIRHSGIKFEVPDERDLPQRLEAVLNAIYAAYGSRWEDAAGADPRARGLADEAIWLARVLRERMPEEAEVRGLLALMLHCEARRLARRAADGRFIPLSEQDPHLWIAPMIDEAERELAAAVRQSRFGRFQLEAAIQSVHADRARSGHTDWNAIALFYEQIVQLSPALGASVGRAAAVAEVKGPEFALSLLDAIESACVGTYQPYWAVRAHLLQCMNRNRDAAEAFDRAIGLTEDAAVRCFLLERRARRLS
jgi:RNA polymerase sigma-70 factor (ECF subfamily)